LADGGVEFYDVKANKIVLMFVVIGFKTPDHRGSVFPFIESVCFSKFAVDSVEDFFAHLAYFGFDEVDWSAGRLVSKVWFVVFQ